MFLSNMRQRESDLLSFYRAEAVGSPVKPAEGARNVSLSDEEGDKLLIDLDRN